MLKEDEWKAPMQKFLGGYINSLITEEMYSLTDFDNILWTAVSDLLIDLAGAVLNRDVREDDVLHEWCMDRSYDLCKWDKEEENKDE